MDLKKLAIGIILLGILVAGYGVIVSLSDGGGLSRAHDMMMAENETSGARHTNLPYILVGAGIIVLGVVVSFSVKKDRS
ncbi:MAG TPA: hypothetical protein VHP61_01580 [Acidobacteriota bacterium]|nr:hypothetical protein [Acidobacteriota bacterium]